jgi:protein-tyrosine sulfotransferase
MSLQQSLIHKWTNADWTEVDLLESCQATSDEAVIAVGGCARSGTTLARVILDSHSSIVIGPPTNVFIPTQLDLDDIAYRLTLNPDLVRSLAAWSTDRVKFIEALAQECKNTYKKDLWGDKTARNVHRFSWILEHFPKGRVIHVIRDGRDVVCSLKTHRRRQVIDGELKPLRNEMPLSVCMERWLKSVRDGRLVKEDPRYYELRYENLIERPHATIADLCAFLEIPFEEAMLRFHEVGGPLRDPLRFPQNIEVTMPIYSSSVGRWLRDLTADDQLQAEESLRPTLVELGYS